MRTEQERWDDLWQSHDLWWPDAVASPWHKSKMVCWYDVGPQIMTEYCQFLEGKSLGVWPTAAGSGDLTVSLPFMSDMWRKIPLDKEFFRLAAVLFMSEDMDVVNRYVGGNLTPMTITAINSDLAALEAHRRDRLRATASKG